MHQKTSLILKKLTLFDLSLNVRPFVRPPDETENYSLS